MKRFIYFMLVFLVITGFKELLGRFLEVNLVEDIVTVLISIIISLLILQIRGECN